MSKWASFVLLVQHFVILGGFFLVKCSLHMVSYIYPNTEVDFLLLFSLLIFAVSVGVSSSPTFHHATVVSPYGRECLTTAKSQMYMMLKDSS